MGELIHKLGIDWKLLVANIVTFLIVLWVLRKFAFAPILKVLDARRALAAKTVDQEKATREALAGAEAQHKDIATQARREAGDILVAARAEAQVMRERLVADAKTDAEKVMSEARAELRRERTAMISEAKKDLATLVVQAAGLVIEKKSGKAFETQSAREALEELSSKS